MEILGLVLVGLGLLVWGGWQLSKRVPALGAVAALALLAAAAFIVKQDVHLGRLGDGVPAAAGAFLLLVLLAQWGCIALAGVLLLAGWRGRSASLSQSLFVFVLLPVAAWAAWRALAGGGASHEAAAAAHAAAGRGTWNEGYAYAIQRQVHAPIDCADGTGEFRRGCLQGMEDLERRKGR